MTSTAAIVIESIIGTFLFTIIVYCAKKRLVDKHVNWKCEVNDDECACRLISKNRAKEEIKKEVEEEIRAKMDHVFKHVSKLSKLQNENDEMLESLYDAIKRKVPSRLQNHDKEEDSKKEEKSFSRLPTVRQPNGRKKKSREGSRD